MHFFAKKLAQKARNPTIFKFPTKQRNYLPNLQKLHLFCDFTKTCTYIALWGSCNGKLEIGIFHFLERNISGIFGHG